MSNQPFFFYESKLHKDYIGTSFIGSFQTSVCILGVWLSELVYNTYLYPYKRNDEVNFVFRIWVYLFSRVILNEKSAEYWVYRLFGASKSEGINRLTSILSYLCAISVYVASSHEYNDRLKDKVKE